MRVAFVEKTSFGDPLYRILRAHSIAPVMEVWYTLSYLLALGALSGWLLFQHKAGSAPLRLLFWVALVAWAGTLIGADADWSYKLQLACRELLVLGVVPLCLLLLNKAVPGKVLLLLGFASFVYLYSPVLASSFPARAPAPEADERWELLVELPEGQRPESVAGLTARYRLHWAPAFTPDDAAATLLDNFYRVNVPDDEDWQTVLAALSDSEAIVYAEDNEAVSLDDHVPQPTGLIDVSRFGLDDPELAKQWGYAELAVDELFTTLTELKLRATQPALIAILDTGIDAAHEDLSANYQSIDADSDTDARGHGTHCAGTAAAVSNNGRGVAGFSQDNSYVRVGSVRVLNQYGMGTQATIIEGILTAADAGAAVISLSLGARANVGSQRAYQEAVKYANRKGAIVIAAAGNNGGDARQIVPASVRGVIAVSAVDTTLRKAGFSNRVDRLPMGLAAPGTLIQSTIPDNKYAAYNGTSMAAPHVAGIVGLLKSLRPELTTEQVYTLLERTGKTTRDPELTGKLVQPGAAVRYLVQD